MHCRASANVSTNKQILNKFTELRVSWIKVCGGSCGWNVGCWSEKVFFPLWRDWMSTTVKINRKASHKSCSDYDPLVVWPLMNFSSLILWSAVGLRGDTNSKPAKCFQKATHTEALVNWLPWYITNLSYGYFCECQTYQVQMKFGTQALEKFLLQRQILLIHVGIDGEGWKE